MPSVVLSSLAATDGMEVVERKGIGHPDSICDALAETLSRNLCREYERRFGQILHHNVDKALLCGGRAAALFGGGKLVAPINIYLAGRAISEASGEVIPVQEIAMEGSRAWLKENLHALDAIDHVRIQSLVQHGSQELEGLFLRGSGKTPLANDTSFGIGHAPLSVLERLVLAIEKRINGMDRQQMRPAWGEDVKVMAVRSGDRLHVTVACAMIGQFLACMDEYVEQKIALNALVRELANVSGFESCDVAINAADDYSRNEIYLTVTGTSAESGDDGQVGRGNRVNGLITPCRPMSLEAAAGKNPVSHVGKIYNVLAREIAEALISAMPHVQAAECFLVSRIGEPVSDPAVIQVRLGMRDGTPLEAVQNQVDELVASQIDRIPELISGFLAGTITLF